MTTNNSCNTLQQLLFLSCYGILQLNHGLSSDHFISVTAHLGGISVIHYPEVSALLGP